jgi:hypothetical protein
MDQMQVVVPEGVVPGQVLQVQSPAGIMQVTVPAGCFPGTAFLVQVPMASAVAQPIYQNYPPQPTSSDSAPLAAHDAASLAPVPVGPVASSGNVPMGTPVSEAMPKVPPLSTLQATYSSVGGMGSDHPDDAGHHEAHDNTQTQGAIPQNARYFAESELAVLQVVAGVGCDACTCVATAERGRNGEREREEGGRGTPHHHDGVNHHPPERAHTNI